MTTTPRPRTVEAHIEFGNVNPEVDYEELIRKLMTEAGWIDLGAYLAVAGWDSVFVQLNDVTWERLVQERYIEIVAEEVSMGIEYEEDDIDVGNQGHMPADCDEVGCPDCIPSPASTFEVWPSTDGVEDEDPTAGFTIPQDR